MFEATLLLALIIIGLVVHVFGVDYAYYCVEQPRWQYWVRDWVLTGLVSGLASTCALGAWCYIVTSVVRSIISGPQLGHVDEQIAATH